MIGRKIVANATSGGARISTARSGIENERFFGTISPKITCRNDTISSATRNDTVSTTATVQCSASSGFETRSWMAGSDTFRISSEHTVMPSWVVASISVACSIAHSAVFAARDPVSARGSICERRAEMIANSARDEERVDEQQDDQPADPPPVTHRAHRPDGLDVAACSARGRSGGRPAARPGTRRR